MNTVKSIRNTTAMGRTGPEVGWPTCRRLGFTLSELMVTAAIAGIVLAAVLATFIATTKNLRAAANYGLIHREGRWAVDKLALDFRAAVDIVNFGTSSVTLALPTGFDAEGNLSGKKNVRYYLSGTNFTRQDLATGKTKVLAANVSTVSFAMYDRQGQPTSSLIQCKGCQVNIKLRRRVIGTTQTEDFLSARLMLRNKP